jgi:hypothetical protein
MNTTITAVILALALNGCATSEVARIAKANGEHVYYLWSHPADPSIELVTRWCDRIVMLEGAAWRDRTVASDSTGCTTEVPGTRDPNDTEFWRFEWYRPAQVTTGLGIPISPRLKGAASFKVGIVGSRERCEAVRITMDKKPQGVAGDDTMHMTDGPCTGPFYFRRVPITPEAKK